MPPPSERRLPPLVRSVLQRGVVGDRTVIAHITQPPSSEIKQKMLSLGERLPGAIQTLLADPFLQIQGRNLLSDQVGAVSAISLAATLPAHAGQLAEGLRILQEALGPDGEEPIFSMPRRFTALLIADILLHQTALPINKRPGVRFSQNRKQAMVNVTKVHSAIPVDRETLEIRGSLDQARQAFQEELAKVLVQTPQTRDEAYFQALLYNTINKIMRDSSLYREFQYYGDSQMHQWITTKEMQALAFLSTSSFSFDLLQEGVFEQLDPHSLGLIFAGQWELFSETAPDEEKLKALGQYFFANPKLQKEFWQPEGIGVDYQIAEWFFLQDRETLDRFIDTAKLPTLTQSKQLSYIRNLFIYFAAQLKTGFPDDPNVPYLLERIRSLAEQFNLTQRIQKELAILEDREPGILYASVDKGLVARHARPEEAKNVIYVSQAPWPERTQEIQPAPAARETVIPTVTSGELQTSNLWGEVQIVREEAAQPVFEALAGKATRQITPGQLSNLITESRAHLATDRTPFIIMPALLPANNPLRRLDECGVVAIEFANGSLAVVVEAAKAGIQTVGPKRIKIQAELEEEPGGSGLARILYAASLLARRSVSKTMLEKQDERDLHGFVGNWNRRAQRDTPRLSFNSGQTSLGRVLFFVGNKPTALELVA